MSLGKRGGQQREAWVATNALPLAASHPFYDALNGVLDEHGFDRFVDQRCARFYSAKRGRPSIPPGVYFRMLFIGYFEGIDSERGICWRVSDSLVLREFLGYELNERIPDHSSLSRIRQRYDLEAHTEVFTWVLTVLAKSDLVKGKTLGVDATTLEANAALRSIVRHDTGESYEEFLTGLAIASGIETPTRQDLAKLDRKRKKKGSNTDWEHPHDPDARITKMKDGRTHLAHKAEHTVDMETNAIVAVTLPGADEGDTETLPWTLMTADLNLATVGSDEDAKRYLSDQRLAEIVADKGYHSNEVMTYLEQSGSRSYISEPDRGRRKWIGKPDAKAAVYRNRRRIRGERGKRLLRERGERLERPFAHLFRTGAMRRVHLRHRSNILKRVLIHTGAANLGLLMRTRFGCGTPRSLQGLSAATRAIVALVEMLMWLRGIVSHRTTRGVIPSGPILSRAG